MINYTIGNILEAETEALVNTVNKVGVMGKGIALQFREAFPDNYKQYKKAVEQNKIQLGQMFVTEVNQLSGPKYIINFPTKAHWRFPSKLSWIQNGLKDLRQVLIDYQIQSVAIPPLGCGQGGLKWEEVKTSIEKELGDLSTEILIFQPNVKVKQHLQKQETTKQARLTPVRAMLLYLLFQYRSMGEYATEFAAEKLSYFLQRFGEKQLKLNFQKGYYGPYSGKVRHVLYKLNGNYLKGYEGKDLEPFEPFQLNIQKKEEVENYINNLNNEERNRLNKVIELIRGFESPFGLELLATVDFVEQDYHQSSPEQVIRQAQQWSPRKRSLLTEDKIQKARERLHQVLED